MNKLGDEKVRSVLAERGDSGRTPRHTLFLFYRGNLDGLAAAATRAGYQVRPTTNNDGLVLETTISVDAESFEAHAQRMEAWSDEFDSEHDGWECKLVRQ